MQNRLYVGGLAPDVTEADLLALFSQHGSVTEASVVLDRFTRKSRGFGFVTMASDTAAQAAIQKLNGTIFKGRTITVNVARPREERPGTGHTRPR
ncbi:MAG: RNA-binding protein [Verrucomicrobiae bacterium]|nr:RNA-binding protein [Verrucomicrobiae bacterium]MCX7721698.1 RNA-binding protein [Verrucomicrobiae bacterium]